MKKLVSMVTIVLFVFACQPNKTQKEKMIGFHPNEQAQDLGWHLGTQEAIDVVVALDKAWALGDYATMKKMFVDTLTIRTPEGKVFKNFDDFQKFEESQNNPTWDFQYAYSVDINPLIGGEHVQAGFLINTKDEDGNDQKKRYHESYYIVQGKIVWLNQYEQKIIEE
tara:strand:- start:62 stop:562 length:501 start_codon:yes stop_codon:yes gene_type:complete